MLKISMAFFGGDKISVHSGFHEVVTLPATNISPENRPLEKEIPIGKHHF